MSNNYSSSPDVLPYLGFVPWGGHIYVQYDFSEVYFQTAASIRVANGAMNVEIIGNYVAGDVDIGPLADFININLGAVGGDFNVDNVWYMDASLGMVHRVHLEDVDHASVDVGYAEEFEGEGIFNTNLHFEFLEIFEIEDSTEVTIDIAQGDVFYGEIDDSEQIDVQTGAGDDWIYFNDTFDFDVATDGGADYVSVHGGNGVVLTGDDDDQLHLHDAQVAYNPGDGNDEIDIIGGRTIGNGVDGDRDTFVFDLDAGGGHLIVGDEFDLFLVDAGQSGLWAAEELDAIDTGGLDGVVDYAGLNLTYVVDDWFGGKG